ncbi:MAG: FAD-dependent thymidylate synthase, partial [Candidatus Nomurabacteria bacterium]|nr:FAD-dependent thymidylate synthase [Candidatus Nomurabacteria bacterium]
TVEFVVDRGITHELVRHRVFSFSQESTRYCNYVGDNFGNELTFIKPLFWDEDIDEYDTWEFMMSSIEENYAYLVEIGAKPEQARSILPNSLKADLVMTGSLEQWREFFKLRVAAGAHPQMREVAIPLLAEMQARWSDVFDDLALGTP